MDSYDGIASSIRYFIRIVMNRDSEREITFAIPFYVRYCMPVSVLP